MKRNDYILLVFVLGIFLFFQAILMRYVHITDYDEAVFLDVARNIRHADLPLRSIGPNGQLYFIHTPLYLYLVTASISVAGDSPNWARFITMQFGVASIALTYLTVRQRQAAISSFIAALLLALNTFVAVYSYFLTMEVPMMFFIILGIYWLAKDETRSSWRYWLGAGITTALAVLLKELALFFVAAAAIYALFSGTSWRERITRLLLISVPSTIGLGAWVYWGISLDADRFKAGLMRWVTSASGSVSSPDGRTETLLRSWMQQLGGDLLSWGTTLLFLISLIIYLIRSRRRLPRIVILLFSYISVALGASLFISLKELRHVIALVPVTAMVIAYAIDWTTVWEWSKKNRGRWLAVLGIALLLAWNISPLKIPPRDQWQNMQVWWEPLFRYRMFNSQNYFHLVRETGWYLAEHTPEDAIIAVVHEGPVMGYYANRSHYFLYPMSHKRVMDVLADTQYLVVDHVVFSYQTEEEIAIVMAYIEDNFAVEQVLEDRFRQITVYRRLTAN